eukprot:10635722-Karenia_brevis.AAC.1
MTYDASMSTGAVPPTVSTKSMTAHSSARGTVCRPGTEPYAAAIGSMVRTSKMHHPQPARLSRQSLLYLPPLPSVPVTRS